MNPMEQSSKFGERWFAVILLKERVRPNYAVGILILIASVATLLYFTASERSRAACCMMYHAVLSYL